MFYVGSLDGFKLRADPAFWRDFSLKKLRQPIETNTAPSPPGELQIKTNATVFNN
jgi:hypothetical protein